MTFTYTIADITSGDSAVANRALIRVRLGDTVNVGHDLEDEEIAAVLALYSNNLRAAALAACDIALAKRSGKADTSGAGINVTRSQRFQQLRDVKRELELSAAATCEIAVVTLTPQEAADVYAGSNGAIPPVFWVGMDRYPRGG